MRSQILAVFSALFACCLGLIAVFLEIFLLIIVRPPFLEWLIVIVASVHYLLIPFGMGLLLGAFRGKTICENGESEKLAISTLAFCYLPMFLVAILFFSVASFGVERFPLMSLATLAVLFFCGPLLLPWFRLIIFGARFGAQWRDGNLRDEFFGRWSRGEKETNETV